MINWIKTLSGAINLDRVLEIRIEAIGGNAEKFRVVADGVIVASGLTKLDAQNRLNSLVGVSFSAGDDCAWKSANCEECGLGLSEGPYGDGLVCMTRTCSNWYFLKSKWGKS